MYFSTIGLPSSWFNDILNVPRDNVAPLLEGVDPVQVAAAMNPMMSSWMAPRKRTRDLPADFLILGATSASGKIAIDVAQCLGARMVRHRAEYGWAEGTWSR